MNYYDLDLLEVLSKIKERLNAATSNRIILEYADFVDSKLDSTMIRFYIEKDLKHSKIVEIVQKDEERPPFEEVFFYKLKINGEKFLEYLDEIDHKVYPNWFSLISGRGFLNGKLFRLTSDKSTFRIFEELVKKSELSREETIALLELLSDKKDHKNNTLVINETAKQIRKSTNLTTEELINNNGNLFLLKKLLVRNI